ncbi:HNH endonuclease [Nocardioides jensenii]|uniref:HNH endonuclease n=1 Tax=Nocardioides jensenii TaxID=1843 RepID=UPI000A964AF9|nr:HNH endonuclease signature motif containing protein [Nocardioides jensenii]
MSGHNNGAVLEGKLTRRGTSNSDQRGSSYTRRRRREWLVKTYRANRDVTVPKPGVIENGGSLPGGRISLRDDVIDVPACRCYRCGALLTVDTVTVDRIIPGCKGGTYRRDNIRPACGDCNSETGGPLANGREHQAAKKAARRRSIA